MAAHTYDGTAFPMELEDFLVTGVLPSLLVRVKNISAKRSQWLGSVDVPVTRHGARRFRVRYPISGRIESWEGLV